MEIRRFLLLVIAPLLVIAVTIFVYFNPFSISLKNVDVSVTHVSTVTKFITSTTTIIETLYSVVTYTKTITVESSPSVETCSTSLTTYSLNNEDFGLCILRIGDKVFLLYLADTPKLWYEGYRGKDDVDFLGIGAVGMLFLNRDGWGPQILIDMGIALGDRLGIGGVIQIGEKLLYVPLNPNPQGQGIVLVENKFYTLGAKMIAFIEYDKYSNASTYFNNFYEIQLVCTR